MSSRGRNKAGRLGGLGRSLQRKQERRVLASDRHTTEILGEGHDNAVSITENTSIDEFLSQAGAAQRSFEAERGQVTIVGGSGSEQTLDPVDERDYEDDDDDEDGDDDESDDGDTFCSIPKKPDWRQVEGGGDGGSKDDDAGDAFRQQETAAFLKWKRHLSRWQQKHPQLPPFEKNLEFWRQLWKMVELSDVVLQVVDARDPLFYFSHDLADYVREVDETKKSVLLLNKADFLTAAQRRKWAEYFRHSDMQAIFFSAAADDDRDAEKDAEPLGFNSPELASPSEVLHILQDFVPRQPLTVGFVGYPNVGKSSTINRFMTNKRLSVSATPGKTKHYQTHVLGGDRQVVLVDGPGLVIPNLNMTKAHMVLGGILPIDNLTDYAPAVEMLLGRIPFAHLLQHYGIVHSCVSRVNRLDRKQGDGMRLLSAFALMRGYMKPGGVPDQARAARLLLKDYVTGKLVFAHAPPEADQADYCPFEEIELKVDDGEDEQLNSMFAGAHVRGASAGDNKKHGNKNKREKARRLYKDPYSSI